MRLRGTNLIIVNVLATYARVVVVMGMTLFTSRWALEILGDTDFGLYSLVGGLIVFILFIGNVMAASMQRFYAYAIGQENSSEIRKWFNCAFALHLFFACVLVLAGLPLGEYILPQLEIPPERLETCRRVFRLSILGAVWTMLAVPYIGMFNARQRIFELSFWNALQAIAVFGFVWGLFYMDGDLLLFYAVGMVGIKMVVDGIQMLRGYFLFRECRLRLSDWSDWKSYGRVLAYSGWQLWSGLGVILSNQGLHVLLNLFGGPRVNTGYALASQVNGAINGVGAAVYQSAVSEIFRREGAGKRDEMIDLSVRTCKFMVILSFIWLLPLFIEMESVLALWLGEGKVPEYAVGFCRVILGAYSVNATIMGYGGAIGAYGRVGSYQSVQGTLLVMTFPLTWLAFKMGFSPEQALLTVVFIASCTVVYCLWWMRRKLGVPASRWIYGVFFKSVYVVIPSTLVGVGIYTLMESSLLRMALVFFLTGLTAVFGAWFLALDTVEREFCLDKLQKVKSLFRRVRTGGNTESEKNGKKEN